MKFRVERDVLADAVGWAARSLPTRPPLPVLAGLLVEANDSGLVLSSFDYEVSARVEVDVEVSDPGRALVSGRLLAEIVRSLPARPVEVVVDDAKVVLTCGSSRFALLTLPVEDYPTLPDLPAAAGTLAGADFATAVSTVAIAAGRDDTLPVLTGVRMEFEGDLLTLAATDRYRLAVRELAWSPQTTDTSAVALVQARSLAETARSLGDADSVTIALAAGGSGDGLIGFEGSGSDGRKRTTTRLLDGEFPKYRALLPSDSAAVASLETAAFIEAVKRVALVAERNTPVRLSFGGDELVLEAGTGDEAQATEAMSASFEGEPLTIAFNPQFLLDGLGAINASTAQLSFTTSTKPAVLTAGGDSSAAASYRYLLMPVRLSG
ncbi:MAG: DNA polymerase III subunit beta [Actinomycetes bacterium]